MRASYAAAINWIADNDDTEWLKDGDDAAPSVTAALVADIFGKDAATVRKHIVRALNERGHTRKSS